MRSPMLRAVTALLTLALVATTARAQAGKSLGVQDINVAAEKDIATMPHMNAALAKELVGKRPFLTMAAVDAFLAAKLSKEQRAALYPKLFLQINLNTASKEEILMVPGIGARMLREFEEYRPYKALAQWEREMGKYVKADEVARMGQYVFVPIDLNTATDEAILTMPGVGARMLREFKEYRPWKTMEQFRREIGKYVDAKEALAARALRGDPLMRVRPLALGLLAALGAAPAASLRAQSLPERAIRGDIPLTNAIRRAFEAGTRDSTRPPRAQLLAAARRLHDQRAPRRDHVATHGRASRW